MIFQKTPKPSEYFFPMIKMSHLIHVGDIDGFGVYNVKDVKTFYILLKHGQPDISVYMSCFIQFDHRTLLDKSCFEALVAYKSSDYEDQPLLSRLLFFVTNHDNTPVIINNCCVEINSEFDFINLDRLSKSKQFQMVWYHSETGETREYTDGNSPDSMIVSPWKLLLETSGDPAFWQRGKFFQTDNIDSWYHWFEDSADLD